jgi:nitrous oxidase accessory protein NosD
MFRRGLLSRVGGTVLATTVASGSVAAKPGKGGKADEVVPDDHETIQGAVDAAGPGDTVLVDGGTYREQVVVNEDLTLRGQSGATVEALDSLSTYTLSESGSSWAPMLLAYGGDVDDGTISGGGTVGVDVTGFTFDGRGATGQSGRKTGILYRNVNGSSPARVVDNSVVDLGTPGSTIGIVAYGDSDVTIEGNELTGFGRGGIGANGDGGEHPSPHVVVRDNDLDSESDPDGSAPNGVQIGFGATGRVEDNTIENCRYAESVDAPWQASGVLVFESDGVQIRNNTLDNNDVAAAVSAWGWFRDSASNCKVTKNTVTDALIGVNLRATAWGNRFTERDPEVSNNKVVNNDVDDSTEGAEGEIGIAVERNDRDGSDDHEPIVENNKLIRNTITGYPEQVSNEGSATKVQAIEP